MKRRMIDGHFGLLPKWPHSLRPIVDVGHIPLRVRCLITVQPGAQKDQYSCIFLDCKLSEFIDRRRVVIRVRWMWAYVHTDAEGDGSEKRGWEFEVSKPIT